MFPGAYTVGENCRGFPFLSSSEHRPKTNKAMTKLMRRPRKLTEPDLHCAIRPDRQANDNGPPALTRPEAAKMCGISLQTFDFMGPQRSVAGDLIGARDAGAALLSNGVWQAGLSRHLQMISFRHSSSGSATMRIRVRGINTVRARLASGELKTLYYHRATGMRLAGEPGSPEFMTSFAAAEQSLRQHNAGTLSGLIREFEETKQWRRLAESTKKEYKRVFTFWDAEYGTCPYRALEDKAFRADVIKWHDRFSEAKPREADNRVTILARVLSWAAKDGPLRVNVLDGFERAYASDRSDIIWLPEQVEAFLAVASPEMQLAMALVPSRPTSCCGSPAASRSFSPCQIGLTMSATGRSGFGKAAPGVPDPAKNSWAGTDIENVAARTIAIVIRMTSPTRRLGAFQLARESCNRLPSVPQ